MARTKYVQVFQGKNRRWYFHLRNTNGRITEPSQGYAHRRSAIKAAKRDVPGVEIRG